MGKMGKIILAIVVVLLIVGGVYAGWNIANSKNEQTAKLTDKEMYETVINNYKNAINEYNIEDLDSEENIKNKYDLISLSLIQHVARYQKEGVKLTYSFYDIDKNGINELIVGASGAAGAIYTYNSQSKKPAKIFYQDTLERGVLSIYDNGVILSSGSGGAALHIYEFGKISQDGTSYQLLESIEEEYKNENANPEYRDSKTRQTLNYKNLDEINNKYLLDSKVVTFQSSEVLDTNTSNRTITKEMAYEGVYNYCHSNYDWSIAEDNPSIMYLEMGDETESEYKVIFRSYTGAFVHFYVNRLTGITRLIEYVPTLNVESEAGTFDIIDYLNDDNK